MTRRALFPCLPLAIAAALVAIGPLRGVEPLAGAPFELSFLILLLGFTGAELVAVDVESRNEAHSVNFVEFAYVAALLLAAPMATIVARPLATVIAMGVIRRQSVYKLLVNVSVAVAESAATCCVFFTLIGDTSPVTPRGWLIIAASTLTGYLVSSALVTLAISIVNGYVDRETVVSVLLVGAVVALANTSLGLVLVGSIWTGSDLGWLVLGVLGAMFGLYRAYVSISERHKNLGLLHDFTRSLGGSELEQLEQAAVDGARQILRGEHGALLLPPVRRGVPALA